MSILDGDRLMEDGGKACCNISHRLCPEEDSTEAGKGNVSEEKLDVGLYGCTSVSHRPRRRYQKLAMDILMGRS